jgi:ectoine hydroxylase-related dioxygenase (phytanoyl-CoA dioxygenase family)
VKIVLTDGFKIFEGVFTTAECDELITRLSCAKYAGSSRAGVRNLMRDPYVSQLASDERLTSITKEIFGCPQVPFKATLFLKTGKANWLVAWHQDTALPLEIVPQADGWGPASVKEGVMFVHAPTWALSKILALRIHLDASTEVNGPLKVIQGSHRKRVLDDDEFREWTASEAVECVVGKGGVIAMSPLLIHASSKSASARPRRVLHIEYAVDLDIADGIRLSIA